jgi:cytochrome P450
VAAQNADGTLGVPYALRQLEPGSKQAAGSAILNDPDTQLDYYRRFGPVYAAGVPGRKGRLVVVSDPELLAELAGRPDQFSSSAASDSTRTEQISRVMLPWYAPSHQRTQLEQMKQQARKLVAAWSARPDAEPADARVWLQRYALEVAGRGACNYDFGLLDGSPPHPFAEAVPESTRGSIRQSGPFPDRAPQTKQARRAREQRQLQYQAELHRTADALVRARKYTSPPGPQHDLLSRLVSTPDPQTGQYLDRETIRDQLLLHLSECFYGPSVTGAWLACILATRPDAEEPVLAEIDAITGGDPGYDLRYEDLLRLSWTTQVIQETLRVYPPRPATAWRSLKDGLLGRYRVHQDDTIVAGTLAAQRDPRFWAPDPDRFDPGQFSPDRVAARPPHAFAPFSAGPPQCRPDEVTLMMLRVVLFELGKHYRLRPAPGSTVRRDAIVPAEPAAVPVIRVRRSRG